MGKHFRPASTEQKVTDSQQSTSPDSDSVVKTPIAVNLAWVLILVPMVLGIFKLIKYAGFQETEDWPIMMALVSVGMVLMLIIPWGTGVIYDKLSQ